jgi:hypothetical protein
LGVVRVTPMNRRGFLGVLTGLIAAPVIIKTPGLLMPIKPHIIKPHVIMPDEPAYRGDLCFMGNSFFVCVVPGNPGTWKTIA